MNDNTRMPKFKAWDVNDKTMYLPEEIMSINLLGESISVRRNTIEYCVNFNELILILGTGLNDKNGKEIYEGGILSYGEYTDGYGLCLYKVIWDDANGQWAGDGVRPEKYGLSTVSSLDPFAEVIGNIYENPELLEGDDNG